MSAKRVRMKRAELVQLIRWMDNQEQGTMGVAGALQKAQTELGFRIQEPVFYKTAKQVGMVLLRKPYVSTRRAGMSIVVKAVHDLYVKLGEKESQAFSELYGTISHDRADEV